MLLNSKVNTVSADTMSEWSISEQQSDNAGFTGFTLQWVHVDLRKLQELKFMVICHRHFTYKYMYNLDIERSYLANGNAFYVTSLLKMRNIL